MFSPHSFFHHTNFSPLSSLGTFALALTPMLGSFLARFSSSLSTDEHAFFTPTNPARPFAMWCALRRASMSPSPCLASVRCVAMRCMRCGRTTTHASRSRKQQAKSVWLACAAATDVGVVVVARVSFSSSGVSSSIHRPPYVTTANSRGHSQCRYAERRVGTSYICVECTYTYKYVRTSADQTILATVGTSRRPTICAPQYGLSVAEKMPTSLPSSSSSRMVANVAPARTMSVGVSFTYMAGEREKPPTD